MATAPEPNDPQGWVKNPPSVFVKVHSVTSKATLNGQLGLILQYLPDKQRYTVLLCISQEVVSLKSDNLSVCSMLEQAKAYWQMLQNNRDLQGQYRQFVEQVQRRSGGLKLEYLLVLLLVVLGALWYFIGFTKLVTLLTVVMMLLTIVSPDLLEGKDWRTVARNAPMRYREVIRTQVPYIGPAVSKRTSYLALFTIAWVAFIGYSLMGTPSRNNKGWLPLKKSSAAAAPRVLEGLRLEQEQQQFYRLGFEDATNQLEFGTSLPKVEAATIDVGPKGVADVDDLEEDDYAWSRTGTAPSRGSSKSPFTLSTGLALFTLYRILQPLAYNPTQHQYDVQLLLTNLRHLDTWRMAALAFAVYRIVAAFL
jgi:hypothetical protein